MLDDDLKIGRIIVARIYQSLFELESIQPEI